MSRQIRIFAVELRVSDNVLFLKSGEVAHLIVSNAII